jgi:hypothetical protein
MPRIRMLLHCGAEMNHRSSFLPEFYEQFRDAP